MKLFALNAKNMEHVISKCPRLKDTSKKKTPKKKAMMATWEDLDEEQENTESQEEEEMWQISASWLI